MFKVGIKNIPFVDIVFHMIQNISFVDIVFHMIQNILLVFQVSVVIGQYYSNAKSGKF